MTAPRTLLLVLVTLLGCKSTKLFVPAAQEQSIQDTLQESSEQQVSLCERGLFDCSDAGNIAWAHQTLPLVLGRKARGVAELRALSTLIGQEDRATVTEGLLREPEFVDYWASVLIDLLGVRKDGFMKQPTTCYTGGALDPDDTDNLRRLATHLRTASASVAFQIDGQSIDWTMNDALRAAIVDDDLTVAYIAYLPALVSVQQRTPNDLIARVSEQFLEHYLDRNLGCVSCHSSHTSKVDKDFQKAKGKEVWDRHFTAPWNLETSLLDGEEPSLLHGPIYEDYVSGGIYFADNCSSCHLDGSALMNGYLRLTDRVPVMSDAEIQGALGSGIMGSVFTPSDTEWRQLRAYLRHRWGDFDALKHFFHDDTLVVGGSIRPWHMSSVCTEQIVEHLMPQGAPPLCFAGSCRDRVDVLDLASDLRTGLDELPAAIAAIPGDIVLHSENLELIGGRAAFAMMLARRIANGLMKESYGARLVLDHGFSRNMEQAEALDALAQAMIVEGPDRTRLSLRAALKHIVGLPIFNQKPPSASAEAPYTLDMLLNPWAALADDHDANSSNGENANSQGDSVHRLSANNLMWSTRHSLGWGEPTWFPMSPAVGPEANEYPRRDYVEQIGGRLSDDNPGSDVWELSSLLYWENVAGTCGLTESESICVPSRQGDCALRDWIDDLMSFATGGTLSSPPTRRELFEAVRDRLLADPEIPVDEADAISAELLDSGTLEDTFPGSQSNLEWERDLRHYCGALMTSPQYTMGGLVTVTTTPAAGTPRFTVCQAGGEVCGESELLSYHRSYVGYTIDPNIDVVTHLPRP